MNQRFLKAVAALFVLVLQASAQLLSCSDINCPVSFGAAKCNIDDTTLTGIGVANFSSSLSPYPLTWTIGFSPEGVTRNVEQRRYYLGTPRGLNLNTRTDILGCALFFTGIEAGLSFVQPDGTYEYGGTASGTCADALGSSCVSDLSNQAKALIVDSDDPGNLQCTDIAETLQLSPPASCTKAGTWGNITAETITGPDSASALQLGDCIPTSNTTYDVHSVATFPNVGSRTYFTNITPLMTLFKATGNSTATVESSEVFLNCMKPLTDDPPTPMITSGVGKILDVHGSLSSILTALVGFMATIVFMV